MHIIKAEEEPEPEGGISKETAELFQSLIIHLQTYRDTLSNMTRELQPASKELKSIKPIYEEMKEASNILASECKVLRDRVEGMLEQD